MNTQFSYLNCIKHGLYSLGLLTLIALPTVAMSQTAVLDFNSLVEGQVFETTVDIANPIGVPDNQPFLDLGVVITATGGAGFGVLYDTEPPVGGDDDLEGPSLATQAGGAMNDPNTYWPGPDSDPLTFGDGGNAFDLSAGLALIVQENAPAAGDINDGVMTSVPPDDNAGGGTMLFEFSSPATGLQFDWADLDGAEDVTMIFTDIETAQSISLNFLAFVNAAFDPPGPEDNTNCPGGCFFDATVFFEDSTHNIMQPVTVTTLNQYAGLAPGTFTNYDQLEVVLAGSGSISQIQFTFEETGTIGDLVFQDNDCDGTFEPGNGETGLSGVRVLLYVDEDVSGTVTPGDTFVRLTTTDGNGAYQFIGMEPGNFVVDVDETSLPVGFAATTPVNRAESLTSGENSDDEDFGFCNPILPVTLSSFEATPAEDKTGVQLEWETATEVNSAGFHIVAGYKSGARGGVDGAGSLEGWKPNVRITDYLIPSVGGGSSGASYEFLDARPLASAAEVRAYYLEEISLTGDIELHGPFLLDDGRGSAPLSIGKWQQYK